MAVPGHRYLKVALGAGPGHEGTHLGAQFKAELDRYFVGAIGERPQLGDQSLHRWLHPGDGLLEALPGLLDHATVPVPPAASDLNVPTVPVLDLDEHAAACLQRVLREPHHPGCPTSHSRGRRCRDGTAESARSQPDTRRRRRSCQTSSPTEAARTVMSPEVATSRWRGGRATVASAPRRPKTAQAVTAQLYPRCSAKCSKGAGQHSVSACPAYKRADAGSIPAAPTTAP